MPSLAGREQINKAQLKVRGKADLATLAPYVIYRTLCFKNVRANCFCTFLLRTQIHMPRHASSALGKH